MLHDICPIKINKMPEFYMIFARKKYFSRFFWGGGKGKCPPCPPSPAPMLAPFPRYYFLIKSIHDLLRAVVLRQHKTFLDTRLFLFPKTYRFSKFRESSSVTL